MSSARDTIFSNLRRSLGVKGSEAPRQSVVADRLRQHPKGLIPARGQKSGEELIETFKHWAEYSLGTVARLASSAEIPSEIARYLRDNNLPATVRMGVDERLTALNWGETALEVKTGPSDGHDLNGLSHAFAGVAETGTLMMVSGADNPTTLNFLPDNHMIVVNAADIAGDYEAVMARIRSQYGDGKMPRTVNMITGPSRSGDIEQTMLLGAHGPRSLHILVIG